MRRVTDRGRIRLVSDRIWKGLIALVLYLILFTLVTAVLCGCCRGVTGQSDSYVATDTLWRDREVVVTVFDSMARDRSLERTVTDSVAPRVDSAGRLVGMDRFRFERITERVAEKSSRGADRIVRDVMLRRRTVERTVTLTRTVTQQTAWWRKALMWTGAAVLAAAMLKAGLWMKKRLR